MIGSLKHVFSLIQQSFNKYSRDDGPWLAGAMAYYAAFSLFPLILVLISVLGFLLRFSPGAKDAQTEAIALVARNASPALAALLNQMLSTVQAQAGVTGPFGLIVLLVGAGGIFAALDGAFDRLWNVPAPASGGILATLRLILFQRLAGFLMLLALGALVVAAFVAGLVMTAVGAYANQLPLGRPGWPVAQALLSMGVDTLVFAVIYKVLPKPYVRWQDALAGALFSAIVWEIGRLVLAVVLAGQTFSAYGVVGAFIALMAWIYYACIIFFIGAELVQVRRQSEQSAAGVMVTAHAGAAMPAAPAPTGMGGDTRPGAASEPMPAGIAGRALGQGRGVLRPLVGSQGAARLGTAGLLLTLLAGALYATLHTLRHR
jgi:membrane protein